MKIEIIQRESRHRYEYDELDYGEVFRAGNEYYLRVNTGTGAISLKNFKDVGFKASNVVYPCDITILEE